MLVKWLIHIFIEGVVDKTGIALLGKLQALLCHSDILLLRISLGKVLEETDKLAVKEA